MHLARHGATGAGVWVLLVVIAVLWAVLRELWLPPPK